MEDQKPAGATAGAGAQTEKQVSSIKNQGTDGGPSTPSSDGAKQGSGRKKWKTKHTVILVIVLAVAWFIGVQVMAAERYAATVNVIEGKDKVAVNPVAKLDFGDLSRDTGANRYVTLKNTGGMNKQIWIVKTGPIAEMMKIDKGTSFTLKPGEEVKVEFSVQVPVSAPIQKYGGTVYIFKMPKLF
ncbi:MAG: hypothetical protein PHI63_03550 [Patescibacteria group bacterium]|nr:hypothetical protein [Patescibacteria group bacterium]